MNMHGSSIPHCLFNLLGYQTNVQQGSSTCINRRAANEKLADWLSSGRLMVQGEICQADTSSLYSFNNEKGKSQLAVGCLNLTLIY